MKQRNDEKQKTGTDLVFAEPGKPTNYWKDKERLRAFFKDRYDLTEFHFQVFCAFGYSLGANPYAGEIIPILFNKGKQNEKLSFILTRDFRGRIAQEQPDYLRHFVTDVCENDKFEMNADKGYPDHTWDETQDRGKLIGAWCAVWKKGIEQPVAYQFVKYSQYKKTGPGAEVWDRYPNDQIKKVAEAHALRQAYFNLFGSTYDSSEVIQKKGIVIDTVANGMPSLDPKDMPAPAVEPQKESMDNPIVEITSKDKSDIQLAFMQRFGGSVGAFRELQRLLPEVSKFVDIETPDQLQVLKDALNTTE